MSWNAYNLSAKKITLCFASLLLATSLFFGCKTDEANVSPIAESIQTKDKVRVNAAGKLSLSEFEEH